MIAMSKKSRRFTWAIGLAALAMCGSVWTLLVHAKTLSEGYPGGDPPEGYNTAIPSSIMTPDKVETRIGTLEFFDGIPTKKSAELLYDNLDFLRGVETFLNGIPAASVEALRVGMASIGATQSSRAIVFDQLMDSNSLFLTGNTDTVYCLAFLDLKKDGPTVIEMPAEAGPGTINDAFFRFVIDTGPPGPDKGKGGKYLILPPDYEGDAPEGYFVAKSTSWVNLVALRGFLVDGKPDTASKMWREGLKIYPLAEKDDPPEMVFINGSQQVFNTIHANDLSFYEELHIVIDREPVEMLDPELRGLFASIGIQKGKPFEPDERMKAILTDAVAVANATARTMFWYEGDPSVFLYEDSYWKRGFVGGNSYQFLKDEGRGGRHVNARSQYFYFATLNSPAIAMKLVGRGSKYAFGYLDADGNYLDGGKTYKLDLPKDPPAEKFMSVVVYCPQTRSELQTDQPFPGKNNKRDKLITNDDGSIDIYFGPKAPEGMEGNWIQTIPDKGWFCLLRLYSPTEAWYDKTWRPGEIELME
jgi:hypothetical protein